MHDKRTYEITFDGHRPPVTVAAPASSLDLAAHAITHLADAGAVQASVALTAGRVTVTDATGTVVATGALTGPGVGPAELPDLGAVTDLLTAGGWTLDYTDDLGGAEECGYLHPSGREIIATPRPGGLVTLTMTDLDVPQAIGAITAAGLAPTAPAATAEPTVPQRLADELHRLADAIATRRLPVGTAVHLRVGVLDSRADLETLAAYLGSEIHEDGGRSGDAIPYTQHVVQLSGREWGPRLEIHAQIQPERSEVERLRARVAELEIQQGGGAR